MCLVEDIEVQIGRILVMKSQSPNREGEIEVFLLIFQFDLWELTLGTAIETRLFSETSQGWFKEIFSVNP